MKLNKAVSTRLKELMKERGLTAYQLSVESDISRSTISYIVNCTLDTVTLRVLNELCRGMGISLTDFFDSPLFDMESIDEI